MSQSEICSANKLLMFLCSAEDEEAAARIQSKNSLESYSYNLRNSLSDEKLADKFEAADKAKLETAVNETISWLDASQEASKDEYESKQKELEAVAKYVHLSANRHDSRIDAAFFPAPSCRSSTVLQVLLPVASQAVLPAASQVVHQAASQVVRQAASLAPAVLAVRKAPASRRSTRGFSDFRRLLSSCSRIFLC